LKPANYKKYKDYVLVSEPLTGGGKAIFTIAGIVLIVGIAGVIYYKRKKLKDKQNL